MAFFRFEGSAEEKFWRWFQKHEDDLFSFERDQDHVFDLLAARLQQVHPDLTFEFGPEEDGRRDFVVSAGGIRAAFPAVHSLVAAAPPLEKWLVVPFRPRRNPDVTLSFGDHSVSASDVLVSVEQDGERLGLTVIIPGFASTPNRQYEQIGFLLLDNALGEFDVETKVGFIEFAESHPATAERIVSLLELPIYVDQHFAERAAPAN
jgi:hypothetical protein